MRPRLMCYPLPFRNDHNLHVLRKGDDFLNQIAQEWEPMAVCWLRKKYLGDVIPSSEINERCGHILSLQNSALDMQVPCEVEVPVNSLAIAFRHRTHISGCFDCYCKALRTKKIAHTFGMTNDHSGL